MLRAAVAALVLGPVALVGVGAADVAAFNSRAAALEQGWSSAQSAGVDPAQLAPARAQLRTLENRRVLFLPYSIFSGALVLDPFGGPESLQGDALSETRTRAQEDLARLKDAGGPNYAAYEQQASALANARTISQYARLARAWEAEIAQLTDASNRLSQAAGGLSNGLPRDVVDGVSRLQSVMSAATSAQLPSDPATQAVTHAQSYLKLGYPDLLAQHDAIAAEVKSAGDTVQHRVDLHTEANQLLGRLPDLMSQAAKYNVSSGVQAKATQAKSDVQAAEQAADDSKMDAATTELKLAVDQLSSADTSAQKAAASAAMADGTACIPGSPAQMIVIHLATQKLIAYDNGCPMLTTPVTTGRAALRTDQGTFTIHAKYASYLMHSPWQPSTNPLWYPDTVVHDAMLFVPADGSFIHSAEWEPASAFGPGSENGPYASHGCVHVQNGPLSTLYNWANVGATVVVES